MYETVTVDQAIAKAQRTINLPVILFIVGGIAGAVYVGIQNILPVWIIPIGIVLAIGFGWLYWSITITKWKVWAFENVRNVHELKKRAVKEKLIWSDYSFWNKTEIWSAMDRAKWESLQSKFNQDDLFTDDVTVPSETVIRYSRSKNFFEMAIMLAIMGVGVYLLAATDSVIIGVICILLGGFLAYKEYKQATNTEPQIILSDKGIQTASTPFYEWNDILDEDVVDRRSGKTTNYYLVYDYPGGSVEVQIDDLETDQKKLYDLLNLYRGRYKKKNRPR
ncbi:MAG: hypothetical protein J7621_02075 [Niastella sp.]|nr:hypothetical protein [Niastella sp.]